MAFVRHYVLPSLEELMPPGVTLEEFTSRGEHGVSIEDCIFMRLDFANHQIVNEDDLWEHLGEVTDRCPLYCRDYEGDEDGEYAAFEKAHEEQLRVMEAAALIIDPFIVFIHTQSPICAVERITQLDDDSISIQISHLTPKEYLDVKEQEYLSNHQEKEDPNPPTQATLFC